MTNSKGLSLIELLITVSILGILLCLSTPITSLFSSALRHSAVDSLYQTLQYARSEAIKRNQIVSVCPSIDARHCHSQWTKGYIVFLGNKTTLPLTVIRQTRLSTHAIVTSQRQTLFSYTGDGRCLTRGSLHLKDNNNAYRIVVYDSGRTRIEALSSASA